MFKSYIMLELGLLSYLEARSPSWGLLLCGRAGQIPWEPAMMCKAWFVKTDQEGAWWFGSAPSSDAIGWFLLVLLAWFYQVHRNTSASTHLKPAHSCTHSISFFRNIVMLVMLREVTGKVIKKDDSFQERSLGCPKQACMGGKQWYC